MAEGFTVLPEHLGLAARQLESAAGQVEPTVAGVEAAAQPAVAGNPEYLTARALEEFAAAYGQAAAKIGQTLVGQARKLTGNAQGYQTTEAAVHRSFTPV
jgi:hypothetical protein